MTPSPGTIAGDRHNTKDGAEQDFFYVHPEPFETPPARSGETWTLYIQCKGAPSDKEFKEFEMEIDRVDLSFNTLNSFKSKLGYGSRDFLYCKERCGIDVANLRLIDFDYQAKSVVENHESERELRLLLTKEEATLKEMKVAITPMKRSRVPVRRVKQREEEQEEEEEDAIDAYKAWLTNLQDEQPDTEFTDDYREETIKTYKEWLRQQGELEDIVSYLDQQGNDHTIPDEDSHDNCTPTQANWPSHARRLKQKGNGGGSKMKSKGGRGTLKGLAAATKRIKSSSQKLEIAFSSRLGGAIGENTRSFVDEVVMFTRKRAPLIGVKKWKDINQNVKNSIASDILNRWDIRNTENANEKIWDTAQERYKGWRSTFSSTYKAYNTYAERMIHKPDDLDIVEWHYLILYFGSAKFKKISHQNSENRKQQRTNHLAGSKSISQVSFEQRDPETGEEPTDMDLWMMTHTKDGAWSNSTAKNVYDNACSEIANGELESNRPFSREEKNNIFQTSYRKSTGCKNTKLHGHGYLAKYPTRNQLINAQLEEHARASAAANQKNIQLQGEVQNLNEKLEHEAAERQRILVQSTQQMQAEHERALNTLREEMREEMLKMIEQQRESAQQTHTQSIIERESSDSQCVGTKTSNIPRASKVIKNLFQNNSASLSKNYISAHQLRNAVKTRARQRSELEDTT